ncbi:hypothetical protein Py17XNL_000202665 [Plasmodium yoelii yoelii]|uniref:Uncharacterized protein n=1 Tax=Plasmodium yoelii yoelii TaxID=73239 RepID=A0AAE9WIZ4_PLAYO|nr:hypothetical protein Py17XNL_000202665 [Plasmodium yoelii yoelii]
MTIYGPFCNNILIICNNLLYINFESDYPSRVCMLSFICLRYVRNKSGNVDISIAITTYAKGSGLFLFKSTIK